jgi:hypothetical protein
LDELEKAHSDVLNILLQIMEDGVLTDGKGRTVCFKNTILVMTSNVGSKRIVHMAKDSDVSRPSPPPEPKNRNAAPLSVAPMRPEEVLSKLQNNAEAMKLMMDAAGNPDMMRAMQTAMSGSPADLLNADEQTQGSENSFKNSGPPLKENPCQWLQKAATSASVIHWKMQSLLGRTRQHQHSPLACWTR